MKLSCQNGQMKIGGRLKTNIRDVGEKTTKLLHMLSIRIFFNIMQLFVLKITKKILITTTLKIDASDYV